MSDFLQRLENQIQSRDLLPRGRKILVAISGGADSMVLLRALNSLAGKFRWKISVAHFNHQLRGRNSDADERLVRKTAAVLKVPLVVGTADVKQFAHRSKLSIEMAARQLRHEFLARVARNRKSSSVVLAHHADDQVELFFLRLLRGAGGEGLAGMKWRAPSPVDRKITLVRPFLDFSKAELCGFARKAKIRFREDATNFTLDARRNRIRNELLPLLRKHYQPGLTKTVLRLMEIIGAESDCVGEAAIEFCKRRGDESPIKKSETPCVVSCRFESLPIAVQRRVLLSQLITLGLTADFDLIESLRQLADVAISVGSKFSVSRSRAGKLTLEKIPGVDSFNPDELAMNLAGRAGEVDFDDVRVNWRFDARTEFKRPRGENACECFDADKIGRRITLRHWRAGDRFQPVGLNTPARLQDLLTNAKIPRERRHRLLVAATAGGEIFWVEGLRISELFKLSLETRQRLVWRWRRS